MKTTVYALEGLNQAFQKREVEVAEPDSHEVLVELVASGICHSDLNVVNGISPAQMPIVLGHEGTGIVKKTGSLITGVKVLTFDYDIPDRVVHFAGVPSFFHERFQTDPGSY